MKIHPIRNLHNFAVRLIRDYGWTAAEALKGARNIVYSRSVRANRLP